MTDGVGGRQVARDAALPGLNEISQVVLVGCGAIGLPLAVRATVPVGTTGRLAESLATRGRSLLVAACPDRSVAGRSFVEQFSVPHIVGAMDPAAAGAIEFLFQQLGPTVAVSTPEAAEAVKLFANVQRDVTFALANQFA